MKTYKFTIEVYATGQNEAEAAENLISELDYLFGLDNNLLAYSHPAKGKEQNESETA